MVEIKENKNKGETETITERGLRLMLLISPTYIDTVSVKKNQKEEETETFPQRIPGPISSCQSPVGI